MVARLFPIYHNFAKFFGFEDKIYKKTEPIHHIIDNIYLGDYRAADNPLLLKQYNITHIINCAFNLPCKYPNQFTYLALNLKDEKTQDIIPKMEESFQFIKKNSSQNIFIHCVLGVSRSGSAVMYYLMKEKGWTYAQAFDYIRKIRSVVQPNEGFKQQLLKEFSNRNK